VLLHFLVTMDTLLMWMKKQLLWWGHVEKFVVQPQKGGSALTKATEYISPPTTNWLQGHKNNKGSPHKSYIIW